MVTILKYILAPFIAIIRESFLFSYNITESYGWSIILLSFLISLLLLPVFILIEKAKKKNDAIKHKMKPLEDEIKRCYKGQERYYYLKTLNRQHHFSPFKAMIPILSLLLQIPFFIAAYQFLENFEPLTGQSFLFIKDLTAPDGLFGRINFLPIVMTIVNLVTAFFYTRNGNTSERKQMVIVAGIFLFLLFNLPSGLVLYWTMNNVFSFIRLFITNPEVFEKSKIKDMTSEFKLTELKSRFIRLLPKLNFTFFVLSAIGILTQLNWAFQHSFDQIGARIFYTFLYSLIITLVFGLISLLHKVDIDFKSNTFKDIYYRLWNIFKPLFITITAFAIISQINWGIQHSFHEIFLRFFLAIISSILITIFFICVVLFFQLRISIKLNIKYKLSSYRKIFIITFWALLIITLLTQIYWGYKHSFHDIVLRILFASIIFWFIMLAIANIYESAKKNVGIIIEKLKHDVKRLLPPLKTFFIIVFLFAIISQIYWAYNHSFNGLLYRLLIAVSGSILLILLAFLVIIIYKIIRSFVSLIKIKINTYLVLLFLVIYFYLAGIFYYNGINKTLLQISFITLLPAQFIGFIYFIRSRKLINRIFFQFALFFLTLISIEQILNLFVFINNKELSFLFLNMRFYIAKAEISNIIVQGIIFIFIVLPFWFKKENISFPDIELKRHWLIIFASFFYLFGLIFYWYPLSVYSTSPESFNFSALSILQTNFTLFSISLISSLILYLISTKKIKRIILIAILYFVVISFFYSSIFPIELGTLQAFRFSKIENLSASNFLYVFEAIFLLAILFFIKYIIRKGYSKQIIIVLGIFIIIPIGQSTMAIINSESLKFETRTILHKTNKNTANVLNRSLNIADNQHSIAFSKDRENVVFIVADMFQGWYLQSLINENPEIKKKLNGFVWYPNTLSITNYTTSSAPSILGGFDYTPDLLNKDSLHTTMNKITGTNKLFRNKVISKGFHFTTSHVPYSKYNGEYNDTFIPWWDAEWDPLKEQLNIGSEKELNYTILWQNATFFCVPLFLKPKIYNYGEWLKSKKITNENTSQTLHYNFLRALPYISNCNSNYPSFIFIWSNASHFPWDKVDDNGVFIPNVGPYENNKWTLNKILNWFEWMKQNDVYDNTKIIVISDHGIRDTEITDSVMVDNPFNLKPSEKISLKELLKLNALLMVKEPYSKGTLKEDWRFMSNVDAISIAMDEANPTKTKLSSRTLNAFLISWKIKASKDLKLPIIKSYHVQDSIFDLNNWTVIEEKP